MASCYFASIVTLFIISFFKYMIRNQLTAATATIVDIVVSYKGKSSFFRCIDTLIQLCCYIFLINLFYFINHFLKHNHYWFLLYHTKWGMLILLFLLKFCLYNLNGSIFQKQWSCCTSLTDHLFYNISHFPFQKYFLKPTLLFHCNLCGSSYICRIVGIIE